MIFNPGRQIANSIVAHVVPLKKRLRSGASGPPPVVVKIAKPLVRYGDKFKGVAGSQDQVITENCVAPHRPVVAVTVAVFSGRVVGHNKTGGVIVHLKRHALQIKQLVANNVSRPTADRLQADPHAGVHHPVTPHADVGLVVINFNTVIHAVADIISINVIAIRGTGKRLDRNAVTKILHLVMANDMASAAQIDAPFAGNATAGPGGPAGDHVVTNNLIQLPSILSPVINAKIDVLDRVVVDINVLRILGINPPAPVLDGHPLNNDVPDRFIKNTEGNHAPVGAGSIDDGCAVIGSHKRDRLPFAAAPYQVKSRVGAGGDVICVARLRLIGGRLQPFKRIPLAAVSPAAAGYDVKLTAGGIWLRPVAGGGGHRLGLPASVGVVQGQPQFVCRVRFEKKRAGRPVI